MRLMSGSDSNTSFLLGSDGGGSAETGTYMWWSKGWMEGGRRGVRRERRKHGWAEIMGLLGRAASAHDTRNMFAE